MIPLWEGAFCEKEDDSIHNTHNLVHAHCSIPSVLSARHRRLA